MSLEPISLPISAVPVGTRTDKEPRGLFFIALFELVKTLLFLAAAAGVFHLVNHDTRVELIRLLHAFRLRGDREFIKGLLLKANVITDPGKRILSGLLLFYALLHATEGVGILLRKRWAEYFTVIMTSIWIPLEVYTLVHHVTRPTVPPGPEASMRAAVLSGNQLFVLETAGLIVNVGIVWFLIHHLRRGGRHRAGREAGPERI